MRRDLFDDSTTGYAQDAALLDRMVADKLTTFAEPIRTEGWSWVETRTSFGYGDRSDFRRIAQEEIDLSDDEGAELARLTAEQNELLDAQYDEDGEEDLAVTARLDSVETRIDELEKKAHAWTSKQMAQAGAIVSLSREGEPQVDRGFVRREDDEVAVCQAVDEPKERKPPPLPRCCPQRWSKS